MRRVVLVVFALSVLVSSSARAQSDWLPCSLRSPAGGGVYYQPPAKIDGLDQIEWWQLDATLVTADFDEFEGADIPEISVRGLALGLRGSIAKNWGIAFSAAYLSVHDDNPLADDGSGLGDMGLSFTYVLDHDGKGAKRSWTEITFGGTFPTGDADEHLGYGEVTLMAGGSWHVGKDGGGSLPWSTPRWLLGIGGSYGYNFLDSDLNTLSTFVTVEFSPGPHDAKVRFTGAAGIRTEWELADRVDLGPGMVRDDLHQTDATVSVGFAAYGGRFQMLLSGRFALDDDGLRDEVIPMVTFIGRLGGGH